MIWKSNLSPLAGEIILEGLAVKTQTEVFVTDKATIKKLPTETTLK